MRVYISSINATVTPLDHDRTALRAGLLVEASLFAPLPKPKPSNLLLLLLRRCRRRRSSPLRTRARENTTRSLDLHRCSSFDSSGSAVISLSISTQITVENGQQSTVLWDTAL
ncbi:hypothetical protein OPV22_007891 [Ensete ventricosum]|uniref:Uncharacterized protein n=1 Tax=Ensete ventricosum TaxID=4639 RepID=A0AAV8RDG5_ENSVE|nr:hypothetical protein OPV22_007891 [Ensete ventricosum]